MKRIYPKRGEVYTLAQIMNELELRDSPSLGCVIAGRAACIQNAHLTDEQFLAVPKAAESQWKYIRETDEWIPVFRYAGPENGVAEFCDLAFDFEADFNGGGEYQQHSLWVTPKGHTRPQYGEPTELGGAVTLEQLLASVQRGLMTEDGYLYLRVHDKTPGVAGEWSDGDSTFNTLGHEDGNELPEDMPRFTIIENVDSRPDLADRVAEIRRNLAA